MEQPEGFVIPGQENKVYKLDKSLYGLKEAHKQWHEKFDNLMISNEFKVNESGKCIYYMYDKIICTIMFLCRRLAHIWFKHSYHKFCEITVK